MLTTTTQDKIRELQTQIMALQEQELSGLRAKRSALCIQIADLDTEIARMSGTKPEKRGATPERNRSVGLALPLSELQEMLAAAPERTLNIRKANLNLANIRALAEANPGLLKMGGIGAWPTVTLAR